MRKEKLVTNQLRRTLSRRQSFRCGIDRDDRGWTMLHVGARKGDLKEVSYVPLLYHLSDS